MKVKHIVWGLGALFLLTGQARANDCNVALVCKQGVKVYLKPVEYIVRQQMRLYGPSTVVMYATNPCRYCERAREFLTQRKIPFVELWPEESLADARNYLSLKGDGYPLIYLGAQRREGFNPLVASWLLEQ